MKKLWDWGMQMFRKYYEQITYLFFGGLATLLNLTLYTVFSNFISVPFATGIGNILNNAICILFAYFTNRTWVFKSKAIGGAAWKEFVSFVTCRLGTMVLDQLVMWLGVTVLGPRVVSPAHLALWGLGVKLFSQVLVVVSNYVLSKLIIFKKKA